MFEAVAVLVIIAAYYSAYIVALYALTVYIAPEEVESLFARFTPRKRKLLKRIASDSRALLQIAAIYKAFTLILISGLAVLLLGKAGRTASGASIVIPIGLAGVWLLYITLIEYLPRRSSRHAMRVERARYLWLVMTVYHLFFPIVLLYRRALLYVKEEERVTEEEKEEIVERAIETLAEQAGIGEAIVEQDEKEMIGHIFQLDQTVVREIMSPRIRIVGIEKNTSFTTIQEVVRRDGFSRYPVFEDTIDRIIGVLYIKDIFNNMPRQGETFIINDYLRRPYFVPESKIIGELLREFKLRKLHIAIVVDEYGGVSGLVTLEDILEEIVGEIQDEHDSEDAPFVVLPDGRYQADASLLIEDLQKQIGTDFGQRENVTIGRLIYDLVGSTPEEGARIPWNNFEFEIIKREGQRIKTVRISRKQ